MTDNIRTNFCPACKEQADRIEAQATEIKRLREALKFYAHETEPFSDIARAALGETE